MTVELRFMPCAEFELSIHGFVDGEASETDCKELLVHLELCDNCSSALELLRRQIRVHRESVESESFLAGVDLPANLVSLHQALISSNLERVSELFYELGKAYFLGASDEKLTIFVHKKAISIEKTCGEGQKVARETSRLVEKAGKVPHSTRKSVRRSEQLFRRSAGRSGRIGRLPGRTLLDNSRRYIEEALILQPTFAKARYYLGWYFHRMDRPEEALAEFRKILSYPDLEPSLHALTLQALGNVYHYKVDYQQAIDCYERIGSLGVLDDSRFFHVLVGLAMLYAKVGDFDRSQETFGQLVRRHPQRLADARATLMKADVFRTQLQSSGKVWNDLVTRYPMLFAG